MTFIIKEYARADSETRSSHRQSSNWFAQTRAWPRLLSVNCGTIQPDGIIIEINTFKKSLVWILVFKKSCYKQNSSHVSDWLRTPSANRIHPSEQTIESDCLHSTGGLPVAQKWTWQIEVCFHFWACYSGGKLVTNRRCEKSMFSMEPTSQPPATNTPWSVRQNKTKISAIIGLNVKIPHESPGRGLRLLNRRPRW